MGGAFLYIYLIQCFETIFGICIKSSCIFILPQVMLIMFRKYHIRKAQGQKDQGGLNTTAY